MAGLSALLRRLPALARGQDEADSRSVAPVLDPPGGASSGSSVRKLLALAQAEALDAFRKAGLPDTPGVFGFDPDQARWVVLGADETPTERWRYVLNHPPENGWRYAGLSQIGRRERPGDPVIALAADLLDQVSSSLARLEGRSGVDASGRHDLEVAFELTMTWMRLVEAVSATGPETPSATARTPKATASRKAATKPRKRSST